MPGIIVGKGETPPQVPPSPHSLGASSVQQQRRGRGGGCRAPPRWAWRRLSVGRSVGGSVLPRRYLTGGAGHARGVVPPHTPQNRPPSHREGPGPTCLRRGPGVRLITGCAVYRGAGGLGCTVYGGAQKTECELYRGTRGQGCTGIQGGRGVSGCPRMWGVLGRPVWCIGVQGNRGARCGGAHRVGEARESGCVVYWGAWGCGMREGQCGVSGCMGSGVRGVSGCGGQKNLGCPGSGVQGLPGCAVHRSAGEGGPQYVGVHGDWCVLGYTGTGVQSVLGCTGSGVHNVLG